MAPTSRDLLKPPTSLQGVVDEGRFYALAVDYAEQIPDLIWPGSVQVYAQMRNDPAIAAVLAAYTLPIRRATWVVDPAGCRDEVARIVADDLGLPVLGDDTPGPARTRGVSWPDHLRSALNYLVYGHSAWELLADVSSGQARLAGLFERVQHTISFIHTGANGEFGGVSQFYHPDKKESAEISADRMLFYSHNREGSAWQGRSLIRAAYAPWLLRREAQRVLATSSRRFGMGVPTIEWATGVTPTPGQMQAAQEAASAARVGDQSGLALPPGATLVLKGLTGGTPDVLAFIKWLGAEISKSCLAQFIDLGGQSSHGSYGMAQSFIDLFTLSLAATAEEVADTVTRQAAARIVAWNWGDTEPVPAVRVTDVGTKHEFTADAIQQLMQAGALQADPALEEYLRKAYQLPARDPGTPWMRMVPTLNGRPKPADAQQPAVSEPAPVAASRPRARSKRAQSSGQGSLFAAAADDEDGAAEFQQQWEQARADALAAWPAQSEMLVDDLTQQVEDRLTAGDVAKLAAVVVASSVVAGVASWLLGLMNPLSVASAGTVLAAAKAQGVKTRAMRAAGAVSNRQVAQVQAQLLATSYAQAAVRAALLAAGPGVNPGQVAETVRQHLNDLATSGGGLVADAVGGALSAAQAAGRRAVFDKYPPKRWRAVESNDANACQECRAIDTATFATLAEVEAAYGPFGYRKCLGGSRCRGHVWPEWA